MVIFSYTLQDERVTIAVSHTVPKEMGPNMHKALLVAELHEQVSLPPLFLFLLSCTGT
jgi:hypothetical protein